ncbi:hypothetical protein, partial [Streptosporangium roseum]|uniref:hypothetical protein n=1 Tax=Streptosporangium roseum TaxID=2001 RepID=UPI0031EC33FB
MFSRALAHRRTTLQLAFQSAAELITQRIRQLGGQAHAPSFSTSISVLGAGAGGASRRGIKTNKTRWGPHQTPPRARAAAGPP